MFTGIVQMVGRIAAVSPHADGVRIAVDTGLGVAGDAAVGDSVAVRGCCLTVVAIESATLTFDVSAETLRCTTGLDQPGDVNLELALRMGDRLGGHLMTGHVDGVGTVESFALWNPGELGALATYAAAALANGDISGEEGDTFEAGDLGEFEVDADGVVLLGEPFTFDADNIGDFDF